MVCVDRSVVFFAPSTIVIIDDYALQRDLIACLDVFADLGHGVDEALVLVCRTRMHVSVVTTRETFWFALLNVCTRIFWKALTVLASEVALLFKRVDTAGVFLDAAATYVSVVTTRETFLLAGEALVHALGEVLIAVFTGDQVEATFAYLVFEQTHTGLS